VHDGKKSNAGSEPIAASGERALCLREARAVPVGRGGAPARLLDRWLVRRIGTLAGNPPLRCVLWDGSVIDLAPDPPRATLTFTDRGTLFGMFSHPELNFGDYYTNGRLQLEGDLVWLVEQVTLGLRGCDRGGMWRALLRALTDRRIHNTHHRARENINHHYDIGNDFYALWLDREHMQYTCAYFPEPTLTLEAAQEAKLHHVCRKLRLRPGEEVVEAGCGWGGLARFMAREYGVRVRAYNISREQVRYARERAAAEGLEDRVEYIEEDYRNIEGSYDAFVSVGMLEHVGPNGYRDLGDLIRRSLRPSGRGLLHTIGRSRPRPMNAWIERRIFPGAYPPSLAQLMTVLEPSRLVVRDVENLRQHYAMTLRHWLRRYEQNIEHVQARFDAQFERCWRLYLSGSIAAFTTGELQLFQVLFAHPDNVDEPWSRGHLYTSRHTERRHDTASGAALETEPT
jgi:cyclopropane-fatty-acyl-phospholipid synthase